jgi:azurin
MRSFAMTVLVAALALTVGCGKSEESHKGTTSGMPTTPAPTAPATIAQPAEPAPAPAPTEAPKPAAQKVEIEISSVGNTMAFDKTALTVPTGAEVHLVLHNKSNMTSMAHNWALVKPGSEATVAAAGLKLGETAGYIDVRDHDVLANTDMAKAGQTVEVTFTAPDPGKYPYICTFPGHYLMMKGVLTVTP